MHGTSARYATVPGDTPREIVDQTKRDGCPNQHAGVDKANFYLQSGIRAEMKQ